MTGRATPNRAVAEADVIEVVSNQQTYPSNVVGLSYEARGEYIANDVKPGDALAMSAEPTNRYDPDAVAVFHKWQKIGYVPAGSRWIAEALAKGEIQEITAGVLEYDEFSVPVILPINITISIEDEQVEVSPSSTSSISIDQSDLRSAAGKYTYAGEISVSPIIIRAHPFWLILAILLIPLLIGALLLFFWWLDTKTTRLEINSHSVKYETGIFWKDRVELSRNSIRTIRVQQSRLNRMLNVGSLEIYTTGIKPEIVARDLLGPNDLLQLLGD